MNKLSAIVITLNEENNIRACLESIKWVDEIIVVDSGSRDKTVEICKSFTDQVYYLPWEGFGKQKNNALDRAHFDWILSIDADERVTPELKFEIESILKDKIEVAGFAISRKNYFGNRLILNCGWHPDYTVRLFNRKKGRFNPVQVHESVQLSGEKGYLKQSFVHFTYRDLSDYLQRMDRYSSLAAKDLFAAHPKRIIAKMLLRPPVTFIKMYLIKRGFKEGAFGFILCVLYSFYTFLKYAKCWELLKQNKP
ncbi:MAG: glycosyltransferase family 2 protein [Nitrospirae bacterium]|nr:glycosyltransferase family 2 protein [Nitrospirota bacterium]MBI3593566.1 glycosyltransferase family 2 protein [Nitrospirota bacterium]